MKRIATCTILGLIVAFFFLSWAYSNSLTLNTFSFFAKSIPTECGMRDDNTRPNKLYLGLNHIYLYVAVRPYGTDIPYPSKLEQKNITEQAIKGLKSGPLKCMLAEDNFSSDKKITIIDRNDSRIQSADSLFAFVQVDYFSKRDLPNLGPIIIIRNGLFRPSDDFLKPDFINNFKWAPISPGATDSEIDSILNEQLNTF